MFGQELPLVLESAGKGSPKDWPARIAKVRRPVLLRTSTTFPGGNGGA
jgi:hypothetical protein